MKQSKLNHSRVDVYRVTHNQGHHNFLISPRLLHEKTLKFIYRNETKLIPVDYLGPHLKYKKIFHTDEATLKREFRGECYEIDENVIFNFTGYN